MCENKKKITTKNYQKSLEELKSNRVSLLDDLFNLADEMKETVKNWTTKKKI